MDESTIESLQNIEMCVDNKKEKEWLCPIYSMNQTEREEEKYIGHRTN